LFSLGDRQFFPGTPVFSGNKTTDSHDITDSNDIIDSHDIENKKSLIRITSITYEIVTSLSGKYTKVICICNLLISYNTDRESLLYMWLIVKFQGVNMATTFMTTSAWCLFSKEFWFLIRSISNFSYPIIFLISSFFWPMCCLFFFDIWILITPLVSSNSLYMWLIVKFQGVSIATAFMTKTSLQIKNKHGK
jgi:hypothetical protein